MKKITSLFILFTLLILPSLAIAEDLESSNYKIEGATFNSGLGSTDSQSGSYKVYGSLGEFGADSRIDSDSMTYQLRSGSNEVIFANTPTVQCFETNTIGSSDCQTGPTYLNDFGVSRVCSDYGCYNRARFEIDTQNNPTQTVYGVQISTDSFTSDIRQIDGVSLRPKPLDERTNSDYKTKTSWEADTMNLRGLQADTTYQLRIYALNGDYTESSPSPTASTTTSTPTISVDLDIKDDTESPSESAPPYTLSFDSTNPIFSAGGVTVNENLIWLDYNTNANYGISGIVKGEFGGLNSANQSYIITSTDADLANVEGFGLQNYDYNSGDYTTYNSIDGTGELGNLTIENSFNQGNQNVGGVGTNFVRYTYSPDPVWEAKNSLYVKARSLDAPPDTDYVEKLTFVIVGSF